MIRRLEFRVLVYGGIALVLGGVALFGGPFYIQIAIGIGIYAILALAWDILSRTGQVSLGMSAFFGIGGYGASLLSPIFGTILGWALGIFLCGAVAVLLGAVTLRLQRLYFTIATLSFSLAIQVLIIMTPDITGGATGITPHVIGGGDPTTQLIIIAALVVVAAIVSDVFLGVRFRPAFFIIRNNPQLAAASGIPVTQLKILAFGVSGMIAGIAGACFTGLYGYVIPTDVFNTNWSILPLAASILGGMDSTLGPLLGAVILSALEEVAKVLVGGVGYEAVYGAVIIIFVVGLPTGLLGLVRKLLRARLKAPASAPQRRAA
jgi:branched-chain amino acid transport system permease protein